MLLGSCLGLGVGGAGEGRELSGWYVRLEKDRLGDHTCVGLWVESCTVSIELSPKYVVTLCNVFIALLQVDNNNKAQIGK